MRTASTRWWLPRGDPLTRVHPHAAVRQQRERKRAACPLSPANRIELRRGGGSAGPVPPVPGRWSPGGTRRAPPRSTDRAGIAAPPWRRSRRLRSLKHNLSPRSMAMCRNIKRLRHPDHPPSDQELHDAALQFVRKISGFHAPSKANEAAFNRAVRDVAAAGRVLFRSLHVRGETEAAV